MSPFLQVLSSVSSQALIESHQGFSFRLLTQGVSAASVVLRLPTSGKAVMTFLSTSEGSMSSWMIVFLET